MEQKFERELCSALEKAETAYGICDKQFLSRIQQRGGVNVIRETIRKNQASPVFLQLRDAGALTLAPEQLVTQGKYGELFTDEEVNFCLEMLLEAGYYAIG